MKEKTADEIKLGTAKNQGDEMFKALGYNKKQITDEFIAYSKKELRYKREWEICIDFNCYDKYLITKNKPYFCLEELQAINKKVKELGWYE